MYIDYNLFVLLAGFLLVSIASNQIAKVFQKLRLPLITGLIFTGIVAGPYVLGLISESSKNYLNFINEAALAFIAFAAGAELYLRELRNRLNSIKWNTFGQLFVTFIIGSVLLLFVAEYIPYMREMNTAGRIGISIITAAIFVARSPASAIAVINELRAKGPFVQTVMGVTVVKDFLVIILFSICLSVAQVLISGEAFNFIKIPILLGELTISFFVGVYVFGRLLRILLSTRLRRLFKKICVLLIGYVIYFFASALKDFTESVFLHEVSIEPLLVCILASFYVTNYTRVRPEFLKILDELSIPVYVAFFTLTGAGLAVHVLDQVIGVAFLLFFIRIVTMIIGSYTGGVLAKDPIKFVHLGWLPYITQAGVALGLTTVVVNEFPTWGQEFSTIIIALVVLNQFIGPPLFKWAIHQVKEDRTKATTPEFDGIRDATIVGFESQSVALARQLRESGWEVQLLTKKEKGSFQEPEDINLVYLKVLNEEGLRVTHVDKSEAIIFMLSDKENLALCDIAYRKFGTKDLIVRLNDRSYYSSFLEMGVKIVDPSTAIVSLLDQFVRSPQATSLLLGMKEGQGTRDIKIQNVNLHGIPIRDLRLPSDVILLSVIRGGQSIITHGYTRLRINDTITVVGSKKSLNEIELKFEK